MAVLTRSELVRQTRVLLGDAFAGSPRFTDEQIWRALQWSQVQVATMLGLTYVEVTVPVVSKVVLTPVDCMRIQHVRIGDALPPDFIVYLAVENGGVLEPYVGGPFQLHQVGDHYEAVFVVEREAAHHGNIIATSSLENGDSALALEFGGAPPDPLVPIILSEAGLQQIPLIISGSGTIWQTIDNPLNWDFTFTDNYGHAHAVAVQFYSAQP